jgi:hypothetical protein
MMLKLVFNNIGTPVSFSSGEVDLVRALTWDLPALVRFRFLGFPDEDLPAVQVGADNLV